MHSSLVRTRHNRGHDLRRINNETIIVPVTLHARILHENVGSADPQLIFEGIVIDLLTITIITTTLVVGSIGHSQTVGSHLTSGDKTNRVGTIHDPDGIDRKTKSHLS